MWINGAVVYLAIVLVMSFVTFAVYAHDKRRAMSKGWRVPERNLQLLALIGGWPGALLAQGTLRHKTQKLSFRIVFWLLVVLHLAAVVAVFTLRSQMESR